MTAAEGSLCNLVFWFISWHLTGLQASRGRSRKQLRQFRYDEKRLVFADFSRTIDCFPKKIQIRRLRLGENPWGFGPLLYIQSVPFYFVYSPPDMYFVHMRCIPAAVEFSVELCHFWKFADVPIFLWLFNHTDFQLISVERVRYSSAAYIIHHFPVYSFWSYISGSVLQLSK